MSAFTVARIESRSTSDLDQALMLFEEILGRGLFSANSLAALAGDAEAALFGCWEGASIIGAATAVKLRATSTGSYSPFGRQATALFDGQVVGSLRDSAVAARHRGRGAGAALLRARLEWLRDAGCEVAVGIAWRHPGPRHSEGLFRRANFQQIGSAVEDFYKAYSEATGLHCPRCGLPCRCAASLFAKRL